TNGGVPKPRPSVRSRAERTALTNRRRASRTIEAGRAGNRRSRDGGRRGLDRYGPVVACDVPVELSGLIRLRVQPTLSPVLDSISLPSTPRPIRVADLQP